MKRSTFTSRAQVALASALLAAPAGVFASDVVLQKASPLTVEQAPAFPENLARSHFGAEVKTLPQSNPTAQLQLSSNGDDPNVSAAALLCDDPTIGYALAAGKSTVLVSLSNIENIASVSFLNNNAKGSLTIAISNADVAPNSPEWHQVDQRSLGNGPVTATIGPSEAKYVRLTFDVTAPGRIAAFGIYATPAISDFTMPRPRKISFENPSSSLALVNDSLTDLHLRARGLYVSSGDVTQVNKMIDGQAATAFQFAAGDSAPTAVIDLGRERTLSRISAIYAAQPGSVDFYVLDNLPAAPNDGVGAEVQKISNAIHRADLPKNLKITDKAFADLKPVGSVVSTDKGRAAIDFPATNGRYIILKWHPATLAGEGFSVAQVAAFGRHPKATQSPGNSQMSDETADANDTDNVDGKDSADGKTILDNKDIPAEGPAEEAQPPAEGPPPALPNVPPFTFIPEVPPTSP